jgi:hypothetical protein
MFQDEQTFSLQYRFSGRLRIGGKREDGAA